MADKHQTSATRTLRGAGLWAEKFTDMRFLNRSGQTVSKEEGTHREYPTVGRPDMYYFLGCFGGFVEVKSPQGDKGQRFDYSQWREDQRQWYYKEAKYQGIQVWMFLVMGNTIRDKRYPKVAFLFPMDVLIRLEEADTRKSLSYERAVTELADYQLHWKGNATWDIPDCHPFRQQFVKGNTDEPRTNGLPVIGRRGFRVRQRLRGRRIPRTTSKHHDRC